MHVCVRLFGSLREAVGEKELRITLDGGATVDDLCALLGREHPPVGEMRSRLRIAVNQDLVSGGHRLQDGDEVAFLPPVSGGSADRPRRGTSADQPRCWLSEQALDVGEVIARVSGDDCGGVVTFLGAVRDHSRGQSIRHLEYEAYPPMAVAEMERIASEAAERWPGARVAVAHRTGHLDIGDLAVVVAAAAPHRAEAFEAARYAIDTLKERVPIWKKEVTTTGEYWVEDHA
jgi:molybdopterin synthase catalytic subunit